MFLTITIGILTNFVYFYWYTKDEIITRPGERTIY